MEDIVDYVLLGLGAIIFCIALALAITYQKDTDRLANEVKKAVLTDVNVSLSSQDSSEDESILTKDEVIQYFLSDLEYNTIIDGITVNASDFDCQNFNYSMIISDYYKRSFRYNSSGATVGVVLESVKRG